MGKKLLVFLMILSLLGSCVSALADDAKTREGISTWWREANIT